MRQFISVTLTLGQVLVVAAAWAVVPPSWFGAPGPAFAELPGLLRRLAEAERRGAELEGRRRAAVRLVGVREAALQDLLGGAISLPQAAARFRAVAREVDEPWSSAAAPDADGMEAEVFCRGVLDALHARYDWQPARKARLAELEAEFAEMRRAGPIRLPAARLPGEA